jgi:Domain of unknown function (DUF4145)
MSLSLGFQLTLDRCPHCGVATPSLVATSSQSDVTDNHSETHKRFWRTYACRRCGGMVLAGANSNNGIVTEMYPASEGANREIPQPAFSYLQQALDSRHAPAGCVMLCASAVDAMLKAHKYTQGSLYSRIDAAATANLLTSEMAAWAHEVRLDANDQRHADVVAPLPTAEDAERCLEFTAALGEFLFVLPARVKRGRAQPPKP